MIIVLKFHSLKRRFYCFNYKMTTKQLDIKNTTYHFYNDLINVLNFETNNLKLDKKKLEKLERH